MEIRTKTRMVEEEVRTYIACDGTEFSFESECLRYEEKLRREESIDKIQELRIDNLNDLMPLTNDGYTEEHYIYTWFEIEDEEDYENLKAAFTGNNFPDELSYPEKVCVETNNEYDYDADSYLYTLNGVIENAKDFFEKFGLEMELRKVGE